MEALVVIVLGLLGIAAAALIGPRLRIASPLLLVAIGIGVSFLPFVPAIQVDPEIILAGILPPLLYASAVSMPSMEFRREFAAISGLSVGLVVVSSVLLGFLFAWLLPDLGLALGIALGAIVSPTDAVATSIVKRVGVSPRIVTVLEGESLLNDATALVLLRTAIAATATAVSFWGVVGDFAYAVVVASVIGYAVGKANLWVRSRVTDATVNTVISFTVPFLASLPAEALGASGLVAAVVAGFVTGRGATRNFSPGNRLSDAQNWRAIELILEGSVFLILGLEFEGLIDDLSNERRGIIDGAALAAVALVAVIAIRAAYVTVTLWIAARRMRRAAALRPRLAAMQEKLDSGELRQRAEEAAAESRTRMTRRGSRLRRADRRPEPAPGSDPAGRIERMRRTLRRKTADIDYFLAVPLGWREGSVIVWAGMRGAVTLAAAQTLPQDTPGRSLVVLIAFFVAGLSLLVQGSTLPWLVRVAKPARQDAAGVHAEREEILKLMRQVAERVLEAHPERSSLQGEERRAAELRIRLEVIRVQRTALLDARDDGIYSSEALSGALDLLDADQISMELRGEGDRNA